MNLSSLPSLVAVVALLSTAASAAEPASLSGEDWSGIRAAHEKWRHRFERNSDGSHVAENPGQRWTTHFDGRGFLVEPSGQDWRWGLELQSYGLAGEAKPVFKEAKITVSKSGLRYGWDDRLEEWFRNDSRGLEQGWTLKQRPAGGGEGNLQFTFAVRGGLKTTVSREGREAAFADGVGTVLTYGGLKAWDASGRDLSVTFRSEAADRITVEVDERGATYPITIDPIAQQARLKADNAGNTDLFGNAVAISDDTVAIAAKQEAGPGDAVPNSGAVYIFFRTGSTWTQQGYLRAPNFGADDHFGTSVAIDGDTVVVGAPREDATAAGDPNNNGAPNAGAIYIFTRSGSTWTFLQRLKAPNAGDNDNFGQSVAIAGNFLAAGAPYEDNDTSSLGTDDELGFDNGAVYVYSLLGGTWSFHTYLKASTTNAGDNLGYSLALSEATLVVGAPVDFGKGRCAVFFFDGTLWAEQAILAGSNSTFNDSFGTSVALSGNIAVVGAPYEDTDTAGVINGVSDDIGAAYVFTRTGGTWAEQAILKAPNAGIGDYFGESVAVSGNRVLVGAQMEDSAPDGTENPSFTNSGAAYLYSRIGNVWSHRRLLKGSNSALSTRFGFAVAMAGDTSIVGAVGEDSSAGAAYTFLDTGDAPTLTIAGRKTLRVNKSKSSHTVRGTADDVDGNLSLIEVKDARPKGVKQFRRAAGTTKWSYRVPLRTGRNLILARATDATDFRSAISRLTVIRRSR